MNLWICVASTVVSNKICSQWVSQKHKLGGLHAVTLSSSKISQQIQASLFLLSKKFGKCTMPQCTYSKALDIDHLQLHHFLTCNIWDGTWKWTNYASYCITFRRHGFLIYISTPNITYVISHYCSIFYYYRTCDCQVHSNFSQLNYHLKLCSLDEP